MFELTFKILDSVDELKNIDLVEFEHEYANNIRGFLLLNFNGKTFGYLEENLPPGIGGINEELLVTWFDLLNDVVKKLIFEKQPYIALKYIENSSTWLEFLVNEKGSLVVSLLEVEPCLGSRSVFTDKPFDAWTYGAWNNVEISMDEFTHEVISKTKNLINSVNNINPALLKSKGIQNLIQSVEDFEKLK